MIELGLLPQMQTVFASVDILALHRVKLQDGFTAAPEQVFDATHFTPCRTPEWMRYRNVFPRIAKPAAQDSQFTIQNRDHEPSEHFTEWR